MDCGCTFYTPDYIANFVASKIPKSDGLVDLYAGTGNLHSAIVTAHPRLDVLALDISYSKYRNWRRQGNITKAALNCLRSDSVGAAINRFDKEFVSIVLNPPFSRLNSQVEIELSKFLSQGSYVQTNRVECLALHSAIDSAPIGSTIISILPTLVIDAPKYKLYWEWVSNSCSFTLLNRFHRAKFGPAEVDVGIVSLMKTNSIKARPKSELRKNTKFSQPKTNTSTKKFEIFRGKVVPPNLRKHQPSVKDLSNKGENIVISKNSPRLQHHISKVGDILIARVGVRMLGRIGKVTTGEGTPNESVFVIRGKNSKNQSKLYKLLSTEKFQKWVKANAKGTANYYITKLDLSNWIEKNGDF